MKKFAKLLILLAFSASILSGCAKKATVPYRAVTEIDISFRYEDMHLQRHYTQTEKMESVLLYLRLLKPLGKPDADPEQILQDSYEITVRFSDGSTKFYRQKAHRFLCVQDHPWIRIDPGQASGLYALMRHYPSDSQI